MIEVTDRMLQRIEGPDDNGCLIWTGARRNGGYGFVQRNRKVIRIHRLVYEAFVEPLAEGLHHLCENKACVNPDHVEPLSQTEHMARHASELCPRGHNDWRKWRSGWRYCRTCINEKSKGAYHERIGIARTGRSG